MDKVLEIFTWPNIRFILLGLGNTMLIASIAIVLSVIVGAILASLRGSKFKALRGLVITYIEIFRNTPNLLWLMIIYLVVKIRPTQLCAIVAFTLFTSAAMAEIIRGGINSVNKGQWEAARSQGMTSPQMYIYIILPQALRNMIPALLSQAITVIKDTAFLRMAMAFPELLGRIIVLTSKYTAVVQIFTLYGLAMLIYFVICFILSLLVRHFQKKLQAEAQQQAH